MAPELTSKPILKYKGRFYELAFNPESIAALILDGYEVYSAPDLDMNTHLKQTEQIRDKAGKRMQLDMMNGWNSSKLKEKENKTSQLIQQKTNFSPPIFSSFRGMPTHSRQFECESACNNDPPRGLIGIQN